MSDRSGIAIALKTLSGEPSGGGASVYITAVAAVTLEIIRDRLERASPLDRNSCICERPIPPKPDPARRLSRDQCCLLRTARTSSATGDAIRYVAVQAASREHARTRNQAGCCCSCSYSADTRRARAQAAGTGSPGA